MVLLEVRAENEVAQGLYRRRGFVEIGRRRGYYQPSGEDADGDSGPDDPVLVGYGGLIAYDDEAHVATLGVTRALQGEGIGSLLLDDLLAEADKRSPVVLLEVRADNEAAQRLYRRRGFVEIGRRRGYYQPSGADAVVMKRKRVRALGRASGGGRG